MHNTPELVGLRVRVEIGCRAGRLTDGPLPEEQKRAVHSPDDVMRVIHAPPCVWGLIELCCAMQVWFGREAKEER